MIMMKRNDKARSSMLRMGIFLLAAFWVLPAHALSVTCKYDMVTQLHDLMKYCSEKIDSSTEQRYTALRQILIRHMQSKNIDLEKTFGARHEEDARRHWAEKPVKERCVEDPQYAKHKQVFFHLTSPESLKDAEQDFEAGKDPKEGDCL